MFKSVPLNSVLVRFVVGRGGGRAERCCWWFKLDCLATPCLMKGYDLPTSEDDEELGVESE